ncbi:2-phosphosulfolactate phosphatase [Aneurinibacillus thermoaerophilus]|uniref:Probable 2-phosphosulfolactate phosphatase n=2 Tax=Aneurinibacillus group TaxID=85151 RepID=A0A1G8CZQ6_ANETH|nr:2-phosphosulfolactate phosphatase [Aneurinibacillus thermoaerophilus]AMA74617.1 2-phosphosulfolactate phosphatase [Aneurinibacillus sp. XH2]MED0674880.1 2-phosphosulfolactate phosphatase [Aneurinibacillus thermoaerophilus]MED0735862.1 2-phosphosulfolactate phosphatase [Aneurinibacillus thermoaerophilus]MED0758468.1 2-phosphosulfolactate phosphatase [Aneurinibacillus thermoaerophilus]MED0762182.1 2-phosphosulfolactate phosphatase [Aneurinibacillus thermoaerophilus]
MKIDVVQTMEEIRQEHITGRTVIVIDVLKAASTIVAALSSGFASVLPVETIGQAQALRSQNVVCAGERHGKKVAEFEYSNSPVAFSITRQNGKQLVLTTTDGTIAISKAARAAHVLIGCFLNAEACIREALKRQLDITLYCAGTRHEFALEDGLAAGLMIHRAQQLQPAIKVRDLGKALEASYLHLKNELPNLLLETSNGKRLAQQHGTDDVLYCGQLNVFDIVPVLKNKYLIIAPNAKSGDEPTAPQA